MKKALVVLALYLVAVLAFVGAAAISWGAAGALGVIGTAAAIPAGLFAFTHWEEED